MVKLAPAIIADCVDGTIFGRAVVPEVQSTKAISSSPAKAGLRIELEAAGRAPVNEKIPAGSLVSKESSRIGMLRFSATSRTGDSVEACTITAPILKSCRAESNSPAENAGLSGAAVAPHATVRNAVNISAPFGNTSATRSPRPMRWEFSVPTTCSTWRHKSAHVRGSRAGAKIAILLGLSLA